MIKALKVLTHPPDHLTFFRRETDGRTAAKEIPKVLSRVQNAYLSGFSETEFETLKIFLRRILHNANLSESNPSHDSPSL